MSNVDMTGLARLGPVGLARVLTELPKGQAKEGVQFALKVKKAQWLEGKYGYRYSLDVVVRTLDMQVVLGGGLWKCYPSMLPEDMTDAIDCDDYDDTWWLLRTVENENSKKDPKATRFKLIDTQQGLGAPQEQEGPSKPAATEASLAAPGPIGNGSERGQPQEVATPVTTSACSHPVRDRIVLHDLADVVVWECGVCNAMITILKDRAEVVE